MTSTDRKVYAVMPAAGLGKRFGAEKNKPFFLLAGKPIIIWSLDLLQSVDEIDEVIPVVREDDITTTAELIEEYGIRKVKRIMAGGKKRQDSVYNGLQAITDAKSIVVIHDCGRPLAETETIRAAIREVKGSDGTVAGVPVKDTIKEAAPSTDACNSDKVMVCRTLRRDVLFAAQTPQVFPFDVIMEAHTRARSEQFYGTDDASLVERYGGKVKIVMGSYTNIKITTPGDIFIAEALLKMRKQGAG